MFITKITIKDWVEELPKKGIINFPIFAKVTNIQFAFYE